VIFRIHKSTGWMPSKILKQYNSMDMRFLRRRYSLEIIAEAKDMKKMKENQPKGMS
jgi:hypothetical protein